MTPSHLYPSFGFNSPVRGATHAAAREHSRTDPFFSQTRERSLRIVHAARSVMGHSCALVIRCRYEINNAARVRAQHHRGIPPAWHAPVHENIFALSRA